jgi:hypothetical protein
VASDKLEGLLTALKERGVEGACMVGEITDAPQPRIEVSP